MRWSACSVDRPFSGKATGNGNGDTSANANANENTNYLTYLPILVGEKFQTGRPKWTWAWWGVWGS